MATSSDVLFSSVEQFHTGRPWGRFLDAGTGLHSVKWIQNLPTSSWTAITADDKMRKQILDQQIVAERMRQQDQLLVGNWMDSAFVKDLGTFDTILADYLIGAVEGFSPYEQDAIISKLKKRLNPNGRLYFIGMNPIPDEPAYPTKIISEVRQARDACILLAGHRCYREFPLPWMIRHIQISGMTVMDTKQYTIMHSEESAIRQIRVAKSKLSYIPHNAMRNGMDKYLTDLECRVKDATKTCGGKIPLSYDYVISAELKAETPAGEVLPEKKFEVPQETFSLTDP